MAAYDAFLLRYADLLQSCGLSDPERHARVVADAYNQPHRAYHNHAHITFMLDKLDNDILNHGLELTDLERHCVKFAIWWHDYVYDPNARDNEIQSIGAWEEFVNHLSADSAVLSAYKAPVSYLIECTISHTSPASAEAEQSLSPGLVSYFLDLDLAILASPREVYRTYADNIRREYIQYCLDDYRKGRANVLRRFLERGNIFSSSAREHNLPRVEDLESRARENIEWELSELDSGNLPKS
ncbi:hypothetical protein TWF696_007461 [Orbilia brochopaga]|uniref:Uncharacterized protein n=1 Tax=Orbilia brochopaga TaxID=3140254 RepID=A0AAV9UNW0_9PEZI